MVPLGFPLPVESSVGMGQYLANSWLPLQELRAFSSLKNAHWLDGGFLGCIASLIKRMGVERTSGSI